MGVARALLPAAAAVLLLGGCEAVEDVVSVEELRDALRSLIEADGAFAIEGLSDAEMSDDDYDVGTGLSMVMAPADTLWPSRYHGIRWGRRITDHDWQLTIDSLVGDAAYVTITTTLSGTLRVGGWIRATDSIVVIQDTLSKPFNFTATRRVRFERVTDSGDLLEDWRITGLTAILGTAGTKIAVEELLLTLPDSVTPHFRLAREELPNRFFNRQNLPGFAPLSAVPTFVTVSNSGPAFPLWSGERAVIRHGRAAGRTSRQRLNDRGLGLDEQALDGVYSGRWITHEAPSRAHSYRLFVEVIDLASLFVEDEPFHGEFMGVPYQIE